MSEKVPILVVLGIDVDGRPHASRFEQRDTRLVRRAAELMGFHMIRIAPDNAELHAIAEALPLGKIFGTGRAFVPFVARAAFDKLAALVEGGVATTAAQRADAGAPAVYPLAALFTADAVQAAETLWSSIEVGSVVLVVQPDICGPMYWESVVIGVDGDDLTLRWMDDPGLEPFHVSRREVALRYPAAV
jgi:hypothetical protein